MIEALVFHHTLLNLETGSSEVLLRNIIKTLAMSRRFRVTVAYGVEDKVALTNELSQLDNVIFQPFTYSGISNTVGSAILEMDPPLCEIVSHVKPRIIVALVWDIAQHSIHIIPQNIPMLLISPFGVFASNGNVRVLYVSGQKNVKRLHKLGIKKAELFFNPLKIPPYNKHKKDNFNVRKQVQFARVGRNDSRIFDPISILAFAKLERIYDCKVKYIYINPSYEAIELVNKLGLKQLEFRSWLTEIELESLYADIDVLAHARLDGETVGIAIAEAMLHQNFIITHKSNVDDEHLNLLDQAFSRVVEKNDVDGYFEAMEFCLKSGQNLAGFGDIAREKAISIFSPIKISEKIIVDCINASQKYGDSKNSIGSMKYSLYHYLKIVRANIKSANKKLVRIFSII